MAFNKYVFNAEEKQEHTQNLKSVLEIQSLPTQSGWRKCTIEEFDLMLLDANSGYRHFIHKNGSVILLTACNELLLPLGKDYGCNYF